MVKKDAIDRGLFCTTVQHPVEVICTPAQYFAKPGVDVNGRIQKSYKKLDDDGMPRLGEIFRRGDVIVGVIDERIESGTKTVTKYDKSVLLKKTIGRVTNVHRFGGHDGEQHARVILQWYHKAEVADKLCSEAQKGTIGSIESAINLPFNPKNGMVPDLLINPHGQPSRMTVSYMVGQLVAKYTALSAEQVDATSFSTSYNYDAICAGLVKYGYKSTGKETLLCGTTGEKMEW